MRVIICGAGQVGYGIAERLAQENHDVTVIDINAKLIETICDNLDVRGIVGHGSHPDTLDAAGAMDADMLIAVTFYDEINMIACQVAHAIFNIPTKIARVRAQAYLDSQYQDLFLRENLPIDVIISPEVEVSEMLLRRIALPGAMDVLNFCDDQVVALAVECLEDCPVLNTPLQQLSDLFPDLDTTVVAVVRGKEIFVAHSNTELLVGDIAYLMTSRDQVRRALGLFGHEEQEANRIIIAGGGNIGLYVARAIERRRHRAKLKIIELDKERASAISDQLDHTLILNGSALDAAVLKEADVDNADLMVTLTNQDQVNILSAIMAKRLGCKANLALLNNTTFKGFTRSMGIDATLDPHETTVSKVLQRMRRGRIRSVHSIANGRAEIIETQAMQTSPLIKKPLAQLQLPEGTRIGAVYRDNVYIRPMGDTQIHSGDRVVLFAMADAVRDVEQMFRVSFEYF